MFFPTEKFLFQHSNQVSKSFKNQRGRPLVARPHLFHPALPLQFDRTGAPQGLRGSLLRPLRWLQGVSSPRAGGLPWPPGEVACCLGKAEGDGDVIFLLFWEQDAAGGTLGRGRALSAFMRNVPCSV